MTPVLDTGLHTVILSEPEECDIVLTAPDNEYMCHPGLFWFSGRMTVMNRKDTTRLEEKVSLHSHQTPAYRTPSTAKPSM